MFVSRAGQDLPATIMDNRFPKQLFPHFYLDGPPETLNNHIYGGWGSYERVFESGAGLNEADGELEHQFESQRRACGDQWFPITAAVTPLIPAQQEAKVFSGPPPDPMDFPEHMAYYYRHHCVDAFSTMSHLLQENYSFKTKSPKGVVTVRWVGNFIKSLNYERCHVNHCFMKIRRLHHLLGDVVSDIPSSLLGGLLHEELTTQREQQKFRSDLTGGALGYMPLHTTAAGVDGCLIFPSGAALDTLNFHRVVPQYSVDKPPSFFMDSAPIAFDLNGTIRQLSLGNMEDVGCVGVRSDYFCGVWLLGDDVRPRLQEVIQAEDRFTCVTVSPHVPDELVVATERGAAYLWTVKKGLQKFREQDHNMYFNAKSSWRWCEFSCHPRVMVYADRTGVELTDARNRETYHTLFRIGGTSACVSGERVMLTKYLSESHAHHHLITTQFSAYIMDDRAPSVPMLKWNHMMESQPQFACVLPGTTQNPVCKVLLGSRRSQEVMLLQYKGGREHACQIQGPVQKLLNPKESLGHLNLQVPHRRHLAQKRLSVPAAGLTAIQNKDYMSVFQLTETGDLFFQTLKLHTHQSTTEETVENKNMQPTVNNNDQSDGEGCQEVLSQVEVIDDVKNDQSQTVPNKDLDLQVAWNKWLKPLFKNAAAKKRHFRHQQKKTKRLVDLKINRTVKLEEDRLTSLRRDINDVMRKKELVLHRETNLPHLDVTSVPDPIDPAEWPDDLSQRLAASWEGEWNNWWEEKLGLNRGKKIEELRRKRRRQKQARGRNRISLSGSFTSSLSYQDSLSGWSSAASQYLGSDEESLENSQVMKEEDGTLEIETQRKPVKLGLSPNDQQTPVKVPMKSALRTPQRHQEDTSTSQSKSQTFLENPQPNPAIQRSAVVTDQGSLSSVNLTRTPTSHTKRHTVDISSLFGSQEPSVDLERLPLERVSSPSQCSILSHRIPEVRSLSQASQPKKKSRMGF